MRWTLNTEYECTWRGGSLNFSRSADAVRFARTLERSLHAQVIEQPYGAVIWAWVDA
jgi:hypothetical protein